MINGLTYIDDIITPEQETELINFIDIQEWNNILSRRTQHYGYLYVYKYGTKNQSNDVPPVPDIFINLFEQLKSNNLGSNIEYNKLQVIVNEYIPGEGIAPHIDDIKQFGEWIISITLNGGCIINFTRNDTNIKEYVHRRSAYEMKTDARYKWRHSIDKVKYDIVDNIKYPRKRRISITFRYIIN